MYKRHRFPPEITQDAVWQYHRLSLNHRDTEKFLAERGMTPIRGNKEKAMSADIESNLYVVLASARQRRGSEWQPTLTSQMDQTLPYSGSDFTSQVS